MIFRLRSLTLAASALTALAFVAGCETSKCKTADGQDAYCAESLETTYGPEETQEADYVAGMGLSIDNVKGDVIISEGSAGKVSVTFKPFTIRGHSKSAEADDEVLHLLDKQVTSDASNVLVSTAQLDGSSDELGAEVDVALPPEFDGALNIIVQGVGEANPGNIIVNYVAGAVDVAVYADAGVSDCDIDGAATILSTTAHCGGRIEITNVSDNLDVISTGLETEDFDVRVTLASVSDAAAGSIKSEDGPVFVEFPSDANFTVTGSTGEGSVLEGDLPTGCEASGDGPKTVTCGDGSATYTIDAGTDGVGDSSITLSYN